MKANRSNIIVVCLLFLLAVPCVSFAGTFYEYETLIGTYTSITASGLNASITFTDNDRPSDNFTIIFSSANNVNTFSLTGTLGGAIYTNLSGTYTMENYVAPDPDFPYGSALSFLVGPLKGRVGFDFIPGSGTGGTVDNGYGRFTQPVPLPAAGWLLGSGLVGFLGIRRKIRK